jgi:hypothetical protein
MNERLVEFQKMKASYKNASVIKDCFHHNKNECQGKIKQSHSIQRNGRLSIIESDVKGNNSIYTFTSALPTEDRLLERLIPIGKKEASTFFGFCDYHDTVLFSPIENEKFDDSYKHLFLHTYRSYAHSYHRKKEECKIYNNPTADFIKIMPPEWIKSTQEGLKMAINDSADRKLQLDEYLETETYDELVYLVYEKSGLFPFAVSSQISPKVSYNNKPMNNHSNSQIQYSSPIITFLPDQLTTFVILAAFPDDKPAVELIDELNVLTPFKLEKAITSLIIANCENTFFSPLFWDSLSKKGKRKLLDEFEENTVGSKYRNKFFSSAFNFFDPRFEMSKLNPAKLK